MKKIKCALLVGLVVLTAAMFMGCDLGLLVGGAGGNTGDLVINFSTPKGRSVSWGPDISMKIDSYEVSGRGPGERVFGPIEADGTESIRVPGLREGTWTVTVLGLNEANDAIGECVIDVTIEAGKTKSEIFIVEEYSGEGTLAIEVQWPEGEVDDPQVLVEISKTIGGEPIKSFVMKPSGTSAVAGTEKKLAAGSYAITISIHDGVPKDGNRITGVNGSIRIAEGRTTTGSMVFDKDSLKLFGNLSVSIKDGMPVPFSVALSKDSDRIWDGHPVTFTARPNLLSDYTYYWFIDGMLQDGETGDEFKLDDELPYGSHFVGVTVLKNGLFASAHTKVTYGDDPGLYFILQLLKPGTDTVVHTFDLTLSVPNYGYATAIRDWSELKHTTLTCANIIQRYEPTESPNDWKSISTEFYPTIVSRTIEHDGSGMVVDDLTMVRLALKDFEGVRTYTFDEDDLDGSIRTDQLDANNTLYGSYSAESGYVKITEYGEVEGVISGSAFLENAIFEDLITDEEDLFFDIKADFSLKRDSDYVIKMRKLTYVFGGELNSTSDNYKPVGREAGLIIRVTRNGQIYNIDGWSTQHDGVGTVYNKDNPLTMPDEDITLYAIFAED